MGNCENNIKIKEKFKNDKFASSMGIVIDELTENHIRMHMVLKGEMENFYNRPHGACIYGLSDAAFSVLSNNQNNISVALDCNITYHNGPKTGQILYVHGQKLSVTKKIGCYLFELYILEKEEKIKIATMKGTSYRTGKPISK